MYKLSKADREFIETHRGRYPEELRWYAVMTHWGREKRVHDLFRKEFNSRGLGELLLPALQEQEGEEPDGNAGKLLFGGCLFFRAQMHDEMYMRVAQYPGVFKIYGKAFRIPEPIADSEMDVFRRMLVVAPRPQLVNRSHIGQRAVVTSGMLQGLSGRIVGVSSAHVKMETQFTFLGQESSIVVSVPRAHVMLEPADTDSPDHAAPLPDNMSTNNMTTNMGAPC